MQRIRVLAIAEAANPTWASVPLVGWSHVEALSRLADVHLVTQLRNREAILEQGWTEGRDFTVIDNERVARPVWRLTRLLQRAGLGWTSNTALKSLPYYDFENQLWQRFEDRLTSGEFDLVHRVTPLSPTTPSVVARRCAAMAKVPFVWGPINGGAPWPKEFASVKRREGEWLSNVRNAYKLLPAYESTRSAASAIIVGSQDTFDQVPRRYHDKCVYIPENAVDPKRFDFDRVYERPRRPLRIAFVGRLVPYKGADMLLEAAQPLLKDGRATLDVIGDGPQMPELRRFAQQTGLGDSVRFAGWVDHGRVHELLSQAHVFGFPSVREFGGGVVLEAMALGVVPVIADYAGPREIVTEKTGFKIPLGSREQLIARFRQTLETIAADPSKLQPLAEQGRRRVATQFTWDAKARQTQEVYRWVLGQRGKPDFGMPFPD